MALLLVFIVAFGSSGKTLTVTAVKYHSTCGDLNSGSAVYSGSEVTVKGPDRKIVGSGAFTFGKNGHANDSHNNWVATCTFKTSFSVPSNLSYYKVFVGSGSGISFQLAELKKNDWEAAITIGYDYDPNAYDSSYSDGYNWGYDNAYSSYDCNWYSNGPSYDNSYDWERGCHAGWLDNDN